MDRYFRISLLFLVTGGFLGVLLRWHFVMPLPHLHFSRWLHAHSHVMFLGWITSTLFLAFVHYWSRDLWESRFRPVIVFMQVMVLGMIIAFLAQGYGIFSIAFLSLFNFAAYYYCYLFHTAIGRASDQGMPFVRMALLFFFLSTLGAFALGPIAANNLMRTEWYYYAIFFFLHFQYNGFFIFGVLGLLMRWLNDRGIVLPERRLMIFRRVLFYACFPAYLLSLLWNDPSIVVVLLAALSGFMQMFACIVLAMLLWPLRLSLKSTLSRNASLLLSIAIICFAIKTFLQLLSGFPQLVDLASEVRFFVLAYLHLVLIGVVTFFLLAWLHDHRLAQGIARWPVLLLVLCFVVSEAVMAVTPFLGAYFRIITVVLFVVSVGMWVSFITPLLRRWDDSS